MAFCGFRLGGLVISILVALRGTVLIVILYLESKEFQSTIFLEGVYSETLRSGSIQILIIRKKTGSVGAIVLLLAVCVLRLPAYFSTIVIKVVYAQTIPTGCHIGIPIFHHQYVLAIFLSLCTINKFPAQEFTVLIHFVFLSRTLRREQLVSQAVIGVMLLFVIQDNDSLIRIIAKHILGIIGHILTSPIYSGFSIMQIQPCAIIALSVLIRTSFNIVSKSSECSGITRNGNYLAVFSYSGCVYRRSREANNFILQWSCRSTCSG